MKDEQFGPVITSTANARVKHVRTLRQKKFRQRAHEFMVEGETLFAMGLAAGFELTQVFVTSGSPEQKTIETMASKGRLSPRQVAFTSDAVQVALAGRDNPQNILAVFHQRDVKLEDCSLGADAIWVVLQEPRDPGNLGTILRTVDAVGGDGVIILGSGCDPYAPEVVRASMGSVFTVPVVQSDLTAFRAWRVTEGAEVAGASGGGACIGLALDGSEPYQSADYGCPLFLMLGNEQTGLPPRYREACDKLVRIPMPGRAESLNLSVSTAIVLYHAAAAMGRLEEDADTPSPLDFKARP